MSDHAGRRGFRTQPKRREENPRMEYLAKETAQKRPEWMLRPETLPKKPPGWKREQS